LLGPRFGRWLALLGGIAVLVITLYPNPGQRPASVRTPLLCLVCGEKGGADVALNLLLFVPLAVGLRLAGWRWRRIVAAGALLSFSIEALQYTVVSGRDASLSDLLTNTLGTAAGAAVAPYLGGLLLPAPGRASRLFAGWCLAWLGVLALTCWLHDPRGLRGRFTSEWAVGGIYAHTGRVLAVRLDGLAVDTGARVPDGRALRRALDSGRVQLEVSATSGRPSADLSWLHAVRIGGTPVLGVAQYGRDAVFLVPARAQLLRLWPPTVQLINGFPDRPGTPVRLEAGEASGRIWLRSTWGGRTREVAIGLSPALGWSPVLPWRFVLGKHIELLNVLWLAALTLPLGYWGWWSPRRRLALAVISGLALAGLALLPRLAGYPPLPWTEWLGPLLGAGLGWAGAPVAAYLQKRCAPPSISVSSSS
jgi:hypothetical protein